MHKSLHKNMEVKLHCVGARAEVSVQVKSAQHGFSEQLDSPTAERCKYSTSQFVLGGIKFYCLANLPEQQGKHTMNKWRTVGNIIELCLNHYNQIGARISVSITCGKSGQAGYKVNR